MTVAATWQGGAAFAVDSGSGHQLITDGPPEHGGVNAGWRPMELLLASLATCSGFDVVHILGRGRQQPATVKVQVHGERADTVPAVFARIELAFTVAGAPRAAAERAVQLSVEKYCSALAMIGSDTKVSWKLVDADA
ncbi:MAG: OsmC family protein [Betaproteobacteria bacterium]|nr:OsmC family protein [Betaproteobacteria bacterium]